MINVNDFKIAIIPFLGILIPFFSNLITYEFLKPLQVVFSNAFFIITSFGIWQLSLKVTSFMRTRKFLSHSLTFRLITLCFLNGFLGLSISSLAVIIWQKSILSVYNAEFVMRFGIITAAILVLLTLICEILYLNREKIVSQRIIKQLDNEKIKAEMSHLKNEIDPHFIFNTLAVLNQLIIENTDKATKYLQILSNVYKYYLTNKNKELVSVAQELHFIDNYLYLLKVKYNDSIQWQYEYMEWESKWIAPGSLQILVENAIKHNHFSDEEPLLIQMEQENGCIKVSNTMRSKLYAVDSFNVGLTNLEARYKLLTKYKISYQKEDDLFVVRLPVIKKKYANADY